MSDDLGGSRILITGAGGFIGSHLTERMRPPASEVRELICDSSAARARLGWQPRVGLEEGVERTARWVADNLALYRRPFAPF